MIGAIQSADSEMSSRSDFSALASAFTDAARPAVENVLVCESIDSTQSCSLRLIDQAEAEEIVLPTTLVIATEQRLGRGRSDRRWESPPGGLYLSWIASEIDREVIQKLPMIAAASAATAVARIGIEQVSIKWPNDLLIDNRKLAGLLVHARHGETTWAAVGFGVNIEATPEIVDAEANEPTSVADHLPTDHASKWAEQLIEVFVEEMAAGVAAPEKPILRWRERIVHRPGDRMVVRTGDGSELRGLFAGLTEDGHLRLGCDGAERIITTGDVLE